MSLLFLSLVDLCIFTWKGTSTAAAGNGKSGRAVGMATAVQRCLRCCPAGKSSFETFLAGKVLLHQGSQQKHLFCEEIRPHLQQMHSVVSLLKKSRLAGRGSGFQSTQEGGEVHDLDIFHRDTQTHMKMNIQTYMKMDRKGDIFDKSSKQIGKCPCDWGGI